MATVHYSVIFQSFGRYIVLCVNQLFLSVSLILLLLVRGFLRGFPPVELRDNLRVDTIELLFGENTKKGPCKVQ